MTTISIAKFMDLDPHTLHDILRLRVDVFVVEQDCAYPELDGRDVEPGTWHLWATANHRIVSYLRVTREPDGHRIGRVCTEAAARGNGLAAKLLGEALEHLGDTRVWMHAQVSVAPFYKRFGFVTGGEQFDDDGIPHILMTRDAP
ncbi:MAG: GNAT family N-acetyltransferase [Stackebrandtia sp.]